MFNVLDGLGLNSELKSKLFEIFFSRGIDFEELKLLKLIEINLSQFLPPSGEIKCNLHPKLCPNLIDPISRPIL